MYYRARYYSPEVGRFIIRDILSGYIVSPLSLNRYVYTKNNPVNWIDPLGKLTILGTVILVGGTVIVVGGGGFLLGCQAMETTLDWLYDMEQDWAERNPDCPMEDNPWTPQIERIINSGYWHACEATPWF